MNKIPQNMHRYAHELKLFGVALVLTAVVVGLIVFALPDLREWLG